MAGNSDWIKMRTDLYRDPKVSMIADQLMYTDGTLGLHVKQNCGCDMAVTRNVMRNVVVGALVSVWGVLRHRGKRDADNLVVKGCSLSAIDDVADLPGFGEAMAEAGWILESGKDLILPNFFEEMNTDPVEESRRKNAERQQRYREKHRNESNVTHNVTVTSQSNTEKSRVEKSNNVVEGSSAKDVEEEITNILFTVKPTHLRCQQDIASISRHLSNACPERFKPGDDLTLKLFQMAELCLEVGKKPAALFNTNVRARSWGLLNADHQARGRERFEAWKKSQQQNGESHGHDNSTGTCQTTANSTTAGAA